MLYKNTNLMKNLGLRRPNHLIFYGDQGTGKGFMVKALAGETGFPIIKISAKRVYRDPIFMISEITEIAKRYRNCIVFIDEADKIFGNNRLGDDSGMIAEFNDALDGIDDKSIQAIFVMAMNDISRFGPSFTDRFETIEFKKPNYEERRSFCMQKIKSTQKHVDLNINYDYLARRTKNMTFRDIERIWNELMYSHIESKKGITQDTISTVLRQSSNGQNDVMFG